MISTDGKCKYIVHMISIDFLADWFENSIQHGGALHIECVHAYSTKHMFVLLIQQINNQINLKWKLLMKIDVDSHLKSILALVVLFLFNFIFKYI